MDDWDGVPYDRPPTSVAPWLYAKRIVNENLPMFVDRLRVKEDPHAPAELDDIPHDIRLDVLAAVRDQAKLHKQAAEALVRFAELQIAAELHDREASVWVNGDYVYRPSGTTVWKTQSDDVFAAWAGDKISRLARLSPRVSAVRVEAEARGLDPQTVVDTLLVATRREGLTVVPKDKAPKWIQKLEDGAVA